MADFRLYDPVGDASGGSTGIQGLTGIGAGGTPNFTGTFQFGGDWPGSNDNYLRINGDPNSATTATSGAFTRLYIPYAGDMVAVSWNSANNVTSQMRVLINGSPATGFAFAVNATKILIPTAVSFSSGDFIEVQGNSAVGTGDPSDVSVHVWVRSFA